MFKRLFVFLFILVGVSAKAQCPQFYNSFGNLSTNPLFVHCLPAPYTLTLQSNTAYGAFSIDWGDNSPLTTGSSCPAFSVIPHLYAATVNTFVITITIPSAACSRTALVVMEEPVTASVSVVSPTTLCAPRTLTFTNTSLKVSPTTVFTWDFGDGTPIQTFNHTNHNQTITHTYSSSTSSVCSKPFILTASNYCRTPPNVFNLSINVFDLDLPIVAVDKTTSCWPDNVFQFLNTSQRNCVPEGNTFQRRQLWNFGNNWGKNQDSLVGWSAWPPTSPISITFTNLGTFTVTLLDSNVCGKSSITTTISLVTPPAATLISPTGNLCQNTPLTFTNASTPGYTYLWNFGDAPGFANLGPGNASHSYTAAGTYTVKLVAKVPNGAGSCVDTSRSVITILAAPVVSFSVSTAVGCGSLSNVTFTNNSASAISFTWTFGNGNTSNLQNPPPQNYLLTGTVTPTLIVTASSGCTQSQTTNIVIHPLPVADFVPFIACLGAPITFTNNSTPTSGTNSITTTSWNFGDFSTPAYSSSTNPTHTYNIAGTYTVGLTVGTAFCTHSVSQTVTVGLKPTAGFVATPTIGCTPFPVSFSNTSIGAINYLWKFLNTTSSVSTATDAIFTYTNGSQTSQNYTVTLIASLSTCKDSIKKVITVRPKPTASFTTNTTAGCAPFLTSFTNTSTNAVSSSWLFGDGNSSAAANPSHTYSNTTLFTVNQTASLAVTNSLGCTDTTTRLITIYPEAVTDFTMSPPAGCGPLNINFGNIPGIAFYSWNHGDGSPTYTAIGSHNWTYTTTSTTQYTAVVTLTAQTTNGCIGSSAKTVTVFANPKADFILGPLSGCSPLTVTFTNTSSGHVSSKWQFNNGQSSLLPDPTATFTSPSGSGPLIYNIKLVAGTSNNCYDSIVKTVTLSPQPKAVINSGLSHCAPKTVTLTSGSAGANTFEWDFGDGQTAPASSVTSITHPYNVGSTQPYLVKLIARSANNCKDSVIVPLMMHLKPEFKIISEPDTGCSPLRVQFNPILGAVQYQWKYDGIIFSNSPTANNLFENKDAFTKTVNVELIASDINTCVDTVIKQIKVFPIPTAKFTAKPLSVFIPNQATNFFNESSPEFLKAKWLFGDGDSSETYSPSHIYNKVGEFQPILIVTTTQGCSDTFALPNKVIAYSESEVQVPNAFTPNTSGSPGLNFSGDLDNDIFHPNIKGVEKYSFSVYSRWGELLFETKNPEEGWDGYYKGQLCIQDTYIWKINASFINGSKYNKTGDVLLLR